MGRRIAIFAAAVGCAATLGAGLPGAAASWVIQPTPNVANVDDNDLVSVSCPGAMFVAVGRFTRCRPGTTGRSPRSGTAPGGPSGAPR